MARVEAPNREYRGPGPGGVFEAGVAEILDDDAAALAYYRSAGYVVDGHRDGLDGQPAVEVVDSRDLDPQQVGSRLRDAAVDPRPEDFLAPVGAGVADPMGPAVVSPEVHASGPKGIRPGTVPIENPARQEAREADYARLKLLQQLPAAQAVAVVIPDLEDRGGLDLSDPGSVQRDVAGDTTRVPKASSDESSSEGAGGDRPPGVNQPKADWVDFAVRRGADRNAAEALTKAELVDAYRDATRAKD